ncbi:hypothetical protein [Vibrio crassostreae]|uniref:hypothetical protein n=1 Tax=Vibrio crassostreae TaxID=246167 RepID=UPI001B300ADB|nr:hypothetical protein [Vibrio crassostreae]
MNERKLEEFSNEVDKISISVLGLPVVETFENPDDGVEFLTNAFNEDLAPNKALKKLATFATQGLLTKVITSRAGHRLLRQTRVMVSGDKLDLKTTFSTELESGATVDVLLHEAHFDCEYADKEKFAVMAINGNSDNDYYENQMILKCYVKAAEFAGEFGMLNAGDYHFNHLIIDYQKTKDMITLLSGVSALIINR